MKQNSKKLFSIMLALLIVLGMIPLNAFATNTEADYELRVLDFEGEYWNALIDEPQQQGALLYGEEGTNFGYLSEEEAYQWTDENTQLHHVLPYNYGTYCYMGGGHAVSNYATANYEAYGDYMNQLTVYDAEAGDEIVRSGGGNNGSDNFAVHFGYIDGSQWNLTEELSKLTFADGVARVVDHMYVNVTVYALNCLLNGNGLTEPGGSFWIKAAGFNGEECTGEVVLALSDGEDEITTDWTYWDLSELGEVTTIQFNVGGSADNGYGFSQPAYFAYDDVAVRFPLPCDHEDTEIADTYERVEGTETHTVTLTCECGEVVESFDEDCAEWDEDANGECDLCKGTVAVETPDVPATGEAWDGETLTEPAQVDGVYQIGTGAELAWFAQSADPASKAVLTADIDLGNKTWIAMAKLSGSFDGQNHTIKNLNGSQGLFATVIGASDASRAEVKNVIVEGTVNGYIKIAGIAGTAYYANLTNCINRADVIGAGSYVAGIVAHPSKQASSKVGHVTVTNCGNEGNIKGTQYVGGIFGYAQTNVMLESCYNTGAITATAATSNAGGIGGYAQGYGTNSNQTNCYNTGAVSGTQFVGGILGNMYNGVTATNCYNTGVISGTSGKIGAITGQAYNASTSVATNCYYLDTSCAVAATNKTSKISATAKTEAEMKSADFAAVLGVAYKANSGEYPVLAWQTVAAGSETYMVTAPTETGITFAGTETAFSTEAYEFTVTINDYYRATDAFEVKVNDEALEAVSVNGKVYSYSIAEPSGDMVITVEGVESTETVIWTGSGMPSSTSYVTNIKIYDHKVVEAIVDGTNITVTLAEDTALDASVRFTVGIGGQGAQFAYATPGFDFVKELAGGRLQQTIKVTGDNGEVATWTVNVQVAGLAESETVEVTKPVSVMYTVTGEDTAIVGANYAFSLSLAKRFRASEDFAVKANGEKLAAVNGEYIVENVTEPIEITVEGIVMKTFAELEAVGAVETKVITPDEEGIFQGLYTVSMAEWGSGNKTYYNNVPYYHITVPCGTTEVKLTYPDYFQACSSGAINSYSRPWGYSSVTVENGVPTAGGISTGDNRESYIDDQGRPYVKVNIKSYLMEEGGNGNGFSLQDNELGWNGVFTFEVLPCTHDGETYYKYAQLEGTEEYTHSVTVHCSICNAAIGTEADELCVDSDNSDTCDKCEGIMDCEHQNKNDVYTNITGWEKHTYKVVCDLCEVQIGETVTEACVDENADGTCDKCGAYVALDGTTVIYSGTNFPYSDYYVAKLTLYGADVCYVDGTTVYLEPGTAEDAELNFAVTAGGSSSGNLGINWNDGEENTKTYSTSLVDGQATVKIYAYKASGAGVSRNGTKTFTIVIHECADADNNGVCDVCGAQLGEPEPEIVLGDIDGSGEVSVKDALAIYRIFQGTMSATEVQKKAADVNGDGEITVKDALAAYKIYQGL